jgi:hypothetical protein
MIELTEIQRRELRNGKEVRARNPDTGQEYVLVPAGIYDRLRSLLSKDGDDSFSNDLYPHVMEVFGREGWNDPSMDVYNELDPRKQP